MKTVYSDAHRLHAPALELAGNRFVPAYEQPVRADSVLDRVASSRLGSVEPPHDFGRAPIEAVHARDFVDFLESAWRDWSAAGEHGDAIASSGRMHDMGQRLPRSIVGRVAHYSFDATPITAGTWTAVYAAAQVALTAGSYLARGDRSAFGLCRPPGHHASRDYCGGYCYLNNAAIAAQSLLDAGGARVAILDVDYHHGNGTQSIFYDRDDVLFVSIHADPDEEYPYFLGYADETGVGRGAGYNLNLPLPVGTGAAEWFDALSVACGRIVQHRARCTRRLPRRRHVRARPDFLFQTRNARLPARRRAGRRARTGDTVRARRRLRARRDRGERH
jgi:acetoin utilization deacetylase AcuC-like enzyme